VGARATGLILAVAAVLASIVPLSAQAGAQRHEPLSASVQARLQRNVADAGITRSAFDDEAGARAWIAALSPRLASRLPDAEGREEFLLAAHYEALRAGLDPLLVLGLIQVESNFRKYAVSRAGARGFMQVMPFWVQSIGTPDHNLFHLRTSLRYGCTILRHYLDLERGDIARALARYNGSLGRRTDYPDSVMAAWHRLAAAMRQPRYPGRASRPVGRTVRPAAAGQETSEAAAMRPAEGRQARS
jgi:soluble lytic murein transglycosylase-like protein